MEVESRPKGSDQRYKATTARDGQMTEEVLSRQERDQLDPNNVDVQIDEPRQEIAIKHEGDAAPTVYRIANVRGFGVHEWRLLVDIVFLAGDFAPLKSRPDVHQRVARLRRLFRDYKGQQSFVITSTVPDYGIALNPKKVWRFIEKLVE